MSGDSPVSFGGPQQASSPRVTVRDSWYQDQEWAGQAASSASLDLTGSLGRRLRLGHQSLTLGGLLKTLSTCHSLELAFSPEECPTAPHSLCGPAWPHPHPTLCTGASCPLRATRSVMAPLRFLFVSL